jgi:acetolactate synthase-1/2/3 large subunit
MLGMHGTYEANNAMQNCDVLLAVGARFDDRVIGNPKHFASVERKIIHIDIDPSHLQAREGGRAHRRRRQGRADRADRHAARKPGPARRGGPGRLVETIDGWRGRDCLAYDRGNTEVIKPQYVVETLWNMTKDADTYITSDVGQHQMWAAQYYRFDEPRRWINSGGLGTMGVGLPYAMGIKLAKPDSEVFCITGEGSIQMCIQELSTCLQYNTPVKIVSLNNRYLGMVRQWQEIEYSGRYSHSYMDALPDFVKLAEAYGHVGMLIERPQDVEPALREARKLKDRTVFLDFRTDPTENVFPMVRAGKGITEMLLGSEDLRNGLASLVLQARTAPLSIARRIYCPPSPRVTVRGGEKRNRDMKHIIAVLLENEAGALSRVVGLFSARATTSSR